MDRMEYVAVKLSASPLMSEDAITDRLNAVAEHGWQLVTPLTGGKGETTFVVYGRYVDE